MIKDFVVQGEVSLSMSCFIVAMVIEFKEIDGGLKACKTPAADRLFQVRDDNTRLLDKQMAMLHHMTGTCIYLCKLA